MPLIYTRFLIAIAFSLLAHLSVLILITVINHPSALSASAWPANSKPLNVDFQRKAIPPSYSSIAPAIAHHNVESLAEPSARVKMEGAVRSKQKQENSAMTRPEVKFYTLKELDQAPAPETKLNLNPLMLQQLTATGMLSLRLWIDPFGNVVKSEMLETTLPKPFAEVALQNFRQAKFHPGLIEGEAVPSQIKIVVHYDPPNISSVPGISEQGDQPN